MTTEELQLEHAASLLEEWNRRGKKIEGALQEALASFAGCSCVLCVGTREEGAKQGIRKALQLLTEDPLPERL